MNIGAGLEARGERSEALPSRHLPVAARPAAMFILQGEPYWRRPACIRIIRRFFEQEKPVAHLCHGAPALASAGLLNGGRTAAYPALEPDVEAAGAYFVDSSAIDDGTMVSAGVWPTIRRGCGNSCGC